jgi:hypothetical protein
MERESSGMEKEFRWPHQANQWRNQRKGGIMKKVLLLMAILLGVSVGVYAGLLMSAEQRERLSRPLAAAIGGCLEHAPDG